MYSHEMQNYIKERNYVLNLKEIIFVQNKLEHPQITRIKFEDNVFKIWTEDDYYMEFGYVPQNDVSKKNSKPKSNPIIIFTNSQITFNRKVKLFKNINEKEKIKKLQLQR